MTFPFCLYETPRLCYGSNYGDSRETAKSFNQSRGSPEALAYLDSVLFCAIAIWPKNILRQEIL
jgi:hypothetical protein